MGIIKVSDSKEEKIRKTVISFLENPEFTYQELADYLGISRSSVRDYLKSPLIPKLFEQKDINTIEQNAANNKIRGGLRGGVSSLHSLTPVFSEEGKFSGNKEYDGEENRSLRKTLDILFVSKIFLESPDLTLNELVVACNLAKEKSGEAMERPYSRSYVYKCLTSSYAEEVINDKSVFLAIKSQLNANQHRKSKTK